MFKKQLFTGSLFLALSLCQVAIMACHKRYLIQHKIREVNMARTLLILLIFFFLIVPKEVYSLEIEKVTTSLQYLYNYYYDPGALKARSDSSSVIKDKDTLKAGKVPDSLPYEEYEPDIEVNDAAFYFVDSIPYIGTIIGYDRATGRVKTVHCGSGQNRPGLRSGIVIMMPFSPFDKSYLSCP